MDSTLTVETIKEKNHLFKPLHKQDQLNNRDSIYWIKVQLNKNMNSSRYMVTYAGYTFDQSSFKKEQFLNRYKHKRDNILTYSFYFDSKKDSKTYYFRVMDTFDKNQESFFSIQRYGQYYQDSLVKPDSKILFIVFGLISGLMLMVSIYNIAIYFYTKEKSFLYYSLMQFCLVFAIIYELGIIRLDMFVYYLTAMLSSFFGTLFMRSFFDTPISLPKIDKFLDFYIFLVFLDFIHLLLYNYSVLSRFGLYSIFGITAIFIGILRLKQGFVPAKFFLFGWIILITSIFMTEHGGDIYGISPFLLGPPLEAVFLAIALAYKLKLSLDEKEEQKGMLIHQSKLASMGEMIGNIAHQWKQPLTYLSYNFMNLREASKRNLLDEVYLNKKLDKADTQLEFMSQTIDNFRDFYLPNKTKELFSVETATLETLEIMDYQFKQHNIKIIMEIKENIEIESYKNEYKQVLLNLLTNAKDIFLQRATTSPTITISLNKNYISILDNGGGIPKEILHRIYEPYFTTKKGNSGIGLYMSKMIIEKDINGELMVENYLNGVLFKIIFQNE